MALIRKYNFKIIVNDTENSNCLLTKYHVLGFMWNQFTCLFHVNLFQVDVLLVSSYRQGMANKLVEDIVNK